MTAVPLFWHSQSLSHDGGAIADVSDAPMGKKGCTFTKTPKGQMVPVSRAHTPPPPKKKINFDVLH